MLVVRKRALGVLPAVAAVLFLVLGASAARADDADTARELFTQGNTFFDLGQFDKAIDAWQRGYQLKNDPGFLYNIGQAYRTMGDPEKAIFFYKRYLINAPKAKNRAEVEQKIEALQKQVDEKQPPPAAAQPVEPAAGTTTATTTPPPLGTSPPPVGSAAAVAPPAESAPAQPAPAFVRRMDVGLGVGFDTWSSGLRSHASPSFALTVDGGYTFGNPAARVRFRLGLLFGYTFLKETDETDGFVSVLIDPTVIVRATSKIRVSADLGLGSVTITGLKPTSTLLIIPKSSDKLVINGAGVSRAVVRLGVRGEYDLLPTLSAFVWPAVASSPQSGNFYAALTRVEVLFGATYRF